MVLSVRIIFLVNLKFGFRGTEGRFDFSILNHGKTIKQNKIKAENITGRKISAVNVVNVAEFLWFMLNEYWFKWQNNYVEVDYF